MASTIGDPPMHLDVGHRRFLMELKKAVEKTTAIATNAAATAKDATGDQGLMTAKAQASTAIVKDYLDGLANVSAWMGRCQSRPAMGRAMAG